MKIGQAIKELRKKANIKQGELAKTIGISNNAMCLIETNQTIPHGNTIKKISEALNIPVPLIYLMSIEINDINKDKVEIYKLLYPTIKEMIFKLA